MQFITVQLSRFLELLVLISIMVLLIYLLVFLGERFNKQSAEPAPQPRHQKIIKDMAVCIVNYERAGGSLHYNLPTRATPLICDGPVGHPEGHTSLPRLYENGWSMIQAVDPNKEITFKEKKIRAYLVLYMERIKPVLESPLPE